MFCQVTSLRELVASMALRALTCPARDRDRARELSKWPGPACKWMQTYKLATVIVRYRRAHNGVPVGDCAAE